MPLDDSNPPARGATDAPVLGLGGGGRCAVDSLLHRDQRGRRKLGDVVSERVGNVAEFVSGQRWNDPAVPLRECFSASRAIPVRDLRSWFPRFGFPAKAALEPDARDSQAERERVAQLTEHAQAVFLTVPRADPAPPDAWLPLAVGADAGCDGEIDDTVGGALEELTVQLAFEA